MPIRLTERDIRFIEFLWKWRRLPLGIASQRFFPECSERRAYNRLLELRDAGYLDCQRGVTTGIYYYGLGAQGYGIIRGRLPVQDALSREFIDAEGEASITAFHLGDWLGGVPESISLVSHRELRYHTRECFPDWVPSLSAHIPSGFTRLPEGDEFLTIAIEVIRHPISDQAISRVLRAYSEMDRLHRVLWLAPVLPRYHDHSSKNPRLYGRSATTRFNQRRPLPT